MGFAENFQAGMGAVFGANKKAMLIIRNNRSKNISRKKLKGPSLSDETEQILSSNAKFMGFHNDMNKTAARAIDGMDGKAMKLTVQYNPSSLSINGSAQSVATSFLAENHTGGCGPQAVYAPSINMSVQLIFDAMNSQDCFMMDKGGLSAGSVVSSISDMAHTEGYSVKDQTNALVALLMCTDTQNVVFCWNEMSFAGVVTEAQASYTMFNTKGQPVRSVVTLKLNRAIGGDKAEDNNFDQKDLDQLLAAMERSGRDANGAASNLLNLNTFI